MNRKTSEPMVKKLPISPPMRTCPAHKPCMNSACVVARRHLGPGTTNTSVSV